MKLSVDDSVFSAVQKLSEGDVVAAQGLIGMVNMDGQAVAMNRMCLLDELDIRGGRLRTLYDNLCRGNDAKMSDIMRSLASGALSERALVAEVSRRVAGAVPMFGEHRDIK